MIYLEESVFVTGGFYSSSHDESADRQVIELRNDRKGPTFLDQKIIQLKKKISKSLQSNNFNESEGMKHWVIF